MCLNTILQQNFQKHDPVSMLLGTLRMSWKRPVKVKHSDIYLRFIKRLIENLPLETVLFSQITGDFIKNSEKQKGVLKSTTYIEGLSFQNSLQGQGAF